MSNFSFVEDDILRGNIYTAFEHLMELVYLSDLPTYTSSLRSSFRKTAIVYTASIIEALLVWFLKSMVSEENLTRETKSFKISRELYKINNQDRIVLGSHVVNIEPVKLGKINLGDINTLCRDHSVINEQIYKDVDKVRILRNRLHIGTLAAIDSEYSIKDLEFVFSVAREIKKIKSTK